MSLLKNKAGRSIKMNRNKNMGFYFSILLVYGQKGQKKAQR